MPNEIPLSQLNVTLPEVIREMFEKPPQGVLEFQLGALTAHMSEPQRSNAVPRLILSLDMTGSAPESVIGLAWREDFWIGTDEDPAAQHPATWETESAQLAKFCDLVGFNCRGQRLADIATWLSGQQALTDCQHFYVPLTNKKGEPNPNALFADGTQKSKARLRWLPKASANPQLYENQTPKGGTSSAAPGGALAPGAAAPPQAAAPPPGFVAGPVPTAAPAPPLGMPPATGTAGSPPATTAGPPTGFPGAAPAPAPPRPARRG